MISRAYSIKSLHDRNVAWAVFLGANTPNKLAREWEITKSKARSYIKLALKNRTILKISRGVFEINPYRMECHDLCT